MSFISYAQNFEDVLLWRALQHIEGGHYIDIGAQDPVVDSVSLAFYEHGWRGIHVEPVTQYANKLKAARPDETVMQVAIGNSPGPLTFFEFKDTGLSTADPAIAQLHKENGFECVESQTPVISLDELLDGNSLHPVHWLKLDVEGLEKNVLDSWQHSPVRPWILVIESTRPLSPEQSHWEWEPSVLAHGYEFVYFDGLNRFYVSVEHRDLTPAFAAGPNVFDNFSLSSSSQFCEVVNIAYHDLNTKSEAQLREYSAELAAQVNASKLLNIAYQELKTKSEAQLRECSAEFAAQIEASKQEAHRWWLAHEALRDKLAAIERSRSWQLVKSLGAIRRYAAHLLGRVKSALRLLILKAIKTIFGLPGLRRVLKPLVARFPFIYRRLHSIAMQEQMLGTSRQEFTSLEGNERDHTVVYLDKRASRVLADLKHSRNGKASQ